MGSIESKIANIPLVDKFANEASGLDVGTTPKILFHYTSNDTFIKIVDSKSLWNTHVLYTNDRREFVHGMELFSKVAIEALESSGLDPLLASSIKKFIIQESGDPLAIPFIFCLTEKGDLLSQWRGYGDDGHGVSVGMRTDSLFALKVIYKHDEQLKIVNKVASMFVALVIDLFNKKVDLNDAQNIRALVLGLFQVSYMQSLRFKNSGWAEEHEWRAYLLKKRNDPTILTRAAGKRLIPYITCDIELEKVIETVMVGPKANFNPQAKALEFIKSTNKLSFQILQSSLSLR